MKQTISGIDFNTLFACFEQFPCFDLTKKMTVIGKGGGKTTRGA